MLCKHTLSVVFQMIDRNAEYPGGKSAPRNPPLRRHLIDVQTHRTLVSVPLPLYYHPHILSNLYEMPIPIAVVLLTGKPELIYTTNPSTNWNLYIILVRYSIINSSKYIVYPIQLTYPIQPIHEV